MVYTKKGSLPFRLGCTSYVYPDAIVPNVRKMAPLVDDIELVLFESSDCSNLPDTAIIKQLAHLARQHQLTYTIHFPIDKKAGSDSARERKAFHDQIIEIINLTKPLDPYAYLLHLEGIDRNATGSEIELWHTRCCELAELLQTLPGLDSRRICIENLAYPLNWHISLVERYDFSFCIDVGHLWLYRQHWKTLLRKTIGRTRVIHLHGVESNKDHVSLRHVPPVRLRELLQILGKKYSHIVTVEVFNEQDTFESLTCINQAMKNSDF